MALVLHTQEPEYYDVEGQENDVIQEDGGEEATPDVAEATQEVAQPEVELEVEPERISDEEDFRIRIWNAEMRCRGREAVVEDLKEQLKDAKSAYEDAVTALRKLASESGGQPLPLFDSPQPAKVESDPVPDPESPLDDDESWRQKNFIEFIQTAGISGLGKKKIDDLSVVVSTFGDFQDLRTKASLEHVHLSKLLPAGFGEKVTDQIEEAFLNQQWKDSIEDPGYDDDPEPEYEDDNSDL